MRWLQPMMQFSDINHKLNAGENDIMISIPVILMHYLEVILNDGLYANFLHRGAVTTLVSLLTFTFVAAQSHGSGAPGFVALYTQVSDFRLNK